MAEILWEPSAEQVAASGLARFRDFLRARGVAAADDDYEALRRWSIEQSPAFWQAIWEFSAVAGARGPRYLDELPRVNLCGGGMGGTTRSAGGRGVCHAGCTPPTMSGTASSRAIPLTKKDDPASGKRRRPRGSGCR